MIRSTLCLCAVLAISLSGCSDTDYSEQFITLPNGKQAYCNKQGYREVRRTYTYEENTLVTDKDGDFIECDASVRPPWELPPTEAEVRAKAAQAAEADARQLEKEIMITNYRKWSESVCACLALRPPADGMFSSGLSPEEQAAKEAADREAQAKVDQCTANLPPQPPSDPLWSVNCH